MKRQNVGAGLVVMLTFGVWASALRAVVLMVLWRWFLVPLGAPPIGIATAWGLGLIAMLLLPTPDPADEPDALEYAVRLIAASVTGSVIALATGWIVQAVAS